LILSGPVYFEDAH